MKKEQNNIINFVLIVILLDNFIIIYHLFTKSEHSIFTSIIIFLFRAIMVIALYRIIMRKN